MSEFRNDFLSNGPVRTYHYGANSSSNPIYNSGSVYSSGSSYMDEEYQQEIHDNQAYANSLYNFDQAEALTLEYAIRDFVACIENGEEDQALIEYNELLQELSKQSNFQGLVRADGDTSMLRATAYKQIEIYLSNRNNEQVNVEEWLENETQNIKERDRQKGFTFREDRVDETTTEDLIEALTGREVYREETSTAGHVWNAVSGFLPSLGRFIFGERAHY